MINPAALFDSVQAHACEYTALSDSIWEHPETAFQEAYAASALMELLHVHGFSIRKSGSGLETAFVAEYGTGRPVIGFLGEYDALPGLNQTAGCTQRQETSAGSAGLLYYVRAPRIADARQEWAASTGTPLSV